MLEPRALIPKIQFETIGSTPRATNIARAAAKEIQELYINCNSNLLKPRTLEPQTSNTGALNPKPLCLKIYIQCLLDARNKNLNTKNYI